MTGQPELPHRGRFQAQGGRGKGIQVSAPWAQETPLAAVDAHRLLNELYDKLTSSQQKERQSGFDQARRMIENVLASGKGLGPPNRKSYPQPPNRFAVRVDVEILAGLAFVPEPENE